jgi:hypothetical protein
VFLKITRLVRSSCGPYSAPTGAVYVVTTGGLASYDADRTDIFRRTASYVDRVLRGEKPMRQKFYFRKQLRSFYTAWVKTGKPQIEQMSSGLPPKADLHVAVVTNLS